MDRRKWSFQNVPFSHAIVCVTFRSCLHVAGYFLKRRIRLPSTRNQHFRAPKTVGFQIYSPETPSTSSRVLWKTETFFSEYGYRPHVSGVFGHRKRRFSNTLSRVESFENGDSIVVFVWTGVNGGFQIR